MPSAIDLVLGVADLEAGAKSFERLGFAVRREAGRAVACNEADCLELRAASREGLQRILLASDVAREASQWVRLAKRQSPGPAGTHPNGVHKLERVYIVVDDLDAAVREYARALDMPAPKVERGTVINADMAPFNIGGAGLTLARPVGPGVAAQARESRGPGPFQALYRTRSMDAAARWMQEHGVPPPVRGVRNTGEQAMLVPPQFACGAYIGFVGPA